MTMVAYMQETLVSKWSLNLTQQCLEKSRIMESGPAKLLPRQIKSLLPLSRRAHFIWRKVHKVRSSKACSDGLKERGRSDRLQRSVRGWKVIVCLDIRIIFRVQQQSSTTWWENARWEGSLSAKWEAARSGYWGRRKIQKPTRLVERQERDTGANIWRKIFEKKYLTLIGLMGNKFSINILFIQKNIRNKVRLLVNRDRDETHY